MANPLRFLSTPVLGLSVFFGLCSPLALGAPALYAPGFKPTAIGVPAFAPQAADKRLKDKDPAVRQTAVEKVTTEGGEKAGQWLLKALGDKDWGVAMAAARGLAKHGDRAAIKPLLKLVMEAPLRLMREEAAGALANLAGEAGAKALSKKLGSKTRVQAALGLALLARHGVLPAEVEALEKMLKHKDEDMHPVAARAWMSCASSEDKPAVLAQLLESERLMIQCSAVEALTSAPDPVCIDTLVGALNAGNQNAVLSRRLVRALVACVGAIEDAEQRSGIVLSKVGKALGKKGSGAIARARFAEWGAAGENPILSAEQALAQLTELSESSEGLVRGIAYRALGSLGTSEALALVTKRLGSEGSSGAAEALVRSWERLAGWENEEALAALVERLATQEDSDGALESMFVALSRPELKGSSAAIASTMDNQTGAVIATAAVALGKNRGPEALGILKQLSKDSDWELRGAAATGLMHLATPEAFVALMELIEDEDPTVALTANWGLRRMSGREFDGIPPSGWPSWWGVHNEKASLRQREQAIAGHEKYGYTVPDALIYSGLDVIVIPGRGDHIELVLDRLGIQYRTVTAGQVAKEGLHPLAILIVGCTGEIEKSDVEVVNWYVRCGGALFTSCWSLTHTANRAFPGNIQWHKTQHEVLDRVKTMPAAQGSTFLNGVFANGSVPIYNLEGAHLIDVVNPLRAEVLIDSVEAAERHGSGEMAAWFPVGHGTVLDSVNHFELQGLTSATDLKKPVELQAYAMNHMGLSMERLRETIKERWWKSRTDAAKNVDDLSAFRLLTNFVREKRLRGD